MTAKWIKLTFATQERDDLHQNILVSYLELVHYFIYTDLYTQETTGFNYLSYKISKGTGLLNASFRVILV